MTDLSNLRNWLFKGLFAESRLNELEAEGVAVRAENDPSAIQRVLPLENFSQTIRRSAMDALPAFLAFFCLENTVRELVVERMSENHGDDWWEANVSKSIKDKVEERRKKEGKNRWHIERGASPIYYTDFGDLTSLIQTNWSDFEDLFPDQHWITSRLSDLEASRNITAHSNPLDSRELDRMRVYLDDWIKQVG